MKTFWKALAIGAGLLVLTIGAFTLAGRSTTVAAPIGYGPEITVYMSPTCGCCGAWVDHIREHGFQVSTVHMNDPELRQLKHDRGVPRDMLSCHTAVVDGYIVEGHTPADVITKLLEDRPDVLGIAVPGMPVGSPGMEGPFTESYNVYSFDREGNTAIFAER